MVVNYAELAEPKGPFPKEDWNEGGLEAVRGLICEWPDRHTLLSEIENVVYPYNVAAAAYPYAAAVEGYGVRTGTGAIALYDKALVLVRYTNRRNWIAGGKRITETLRPSSINIPLPHGGFRWGSQTGVAIEPNEAPNKTIRVVSYLLTYWRVASIPVAALLYQGCVNNAPVTSYSLGLTFAAETLLLAGVTASRDIGLGIAPTWRLTYNFAYHPAGWNTYWRPGATPPGFYRMYHVDIPTDGGLYLNHPLVAFSGLIPA